MSSEFHRRRIVREKILSLAGALAVFAAWPAQARAAERVTLRNGFTLRCDHHGQVDGRVRLYLSPGEDSYIEFAPAEIATFELIPDPPAPVAPAAIPSPQTPARLTPADLHEMLTRAGAEHNLDVDLLASVVKAESDGNARAVSRAGAQGLMQLMPGTAAGLGVHDSFQPEQNVRGGSAYLDALLTRYRDNLALALAAYNAGPEAVDKYKGIPPYRETRAYVARVIHEFNRRVLAREAQALRIGATAAAPAAQPAASR
ncbi:MAG: lytic transglycosylase domain-containing protein [Terracidiphilus sp.]